jgi:hypothetical protein
MHQAPLLSANLPLERASVPSPPVCVAKLHKCLRGEDVVRPEYPLGISAVAAAETCEAVGGVFIHPYRARLTSGRNRVKLLVDYDHVLLRADEINWSVNED